MSNKEDTFEYKALNSELMQKYLPPEEELNTIPTRWHRPVSPAITEQLCKTVTEHETRHKSLLEMCNDRYQLALTNTPEGLSEQERFLWRMGFAEGMSVVLEYIKSGQPAPRV